MKKVLERFLKYWKKRNYQRMYNLCQKTWVSKHTKGELMNMFKSVDLEDYNILEIEWDKPEIKKVKLGLKINGVYKITHVNVICEIKAFKPSAKGNWGVNPISLLKTEKIDNGVMVFM